MLVLLAGSDLPPPVGFIWVAAGAVAAGALVRALVPPVLGLRHTIGVLRTLLAASGIGAGVGVACATLLVLLGSGEPTVDSPSAGQAATFVVVVAAAPGAAVSLLALTAVGTRLAA